MGDAVWTCLLLIILAFGTGYYMARQTFPKTELRQCREDRVEATETLEAAEDRLKYCDKIIRLYVDTAAYYQKRFLGCLSEEKREKRKQR
jgi:hypothetical protein